MGPPRGKGVTVVTGMIGCSGSHKESNPNSSDGVVAHPALAGMASSPGILLGSATSIGGCLVLHQGARRRTVLQAGGLACALVGHHFKPVVKVLEFGMYGTHRADFPAEATRDAVVLVDVHLHSIPVRFNLPAPDPGN